MEVYSGTPFPAFHEPPDESIHRLVNRVVSPDLD